MSDELPKIPLDHRLLAKFAKETERADPIDWTKVNVDRDMSYDLMASQIAEMFRDYEMQGMHRDQQLTIALATIVKLSVENFVLNQQILQPEKKPS